MQRTATITQQMMLMMPTTTPLAGAGSIPAKTGSNNLIAAMIAQMKTK